MHTFAVIVLVGPDDVEIERLCDLVASVQWWERRAAHWVLIDDGFRERQVLRHLRFPPGSDAVCLRYPRLRNDTRRTMALGAGTLLALSHVQAHTRAAFAVKLDTDALVIAPFADAIERVIRAAPEAGVIGTLGDSCHPERRDPLKKLEAMSNLVGYLHLLPPPPRDLDDPDAVVCIDGLGPVTVTKLRAFAMVRPHIERAVAQGYRKHQYCQGGAYVVTRECMDGMANAGYFQQLEAWNHAPTGEDVMMGMYARAVGLQLLDCCGMGDPFGVQYRGLPYAPDVMVSRRYSLIHSLKDDPRYSERELRRYFADLRTTRHSAD